ncbi:glycoside hydrolase family 16 protein [Flavobacterium sp. 3HN19-14]|uniref:glycoside hydrolase family 16 protein n=1 Tax=Flavobacterium sp. 3HN19-14 TaxID=3448133 RepID=UPI003EDF4D7A
MTFSDNGFMGYYIGQSTYEILSITDNRMVVRAVMGGNSSLAWYHTFSTQPPVQGGDDNFDNLVWQDNFDTDGAPNPANWGYDIGLGGGWGNNEVQYYTDASSNVIVQGGMLKITAKKENFGGAQYTSARLKSENKFDFKYGKVEFRAKLPTGGGTWPALWMLGANYATNAWPFLWRNRCDGRSWQPAKCYSRHFALSRKFWR